MACYRTGLIASCLLLGSPLLAQAAPPAGHPEDLLERAHQARGEGDRAKAYERYRAALTSHKRFDTAANLGLLEFELKRYAECVEHLKWALASYPEKAGPALRSRLRDRLQRAQRKLQPSLPTESAAVGPLPQLLMVSGVALSALTLGVGAGLIMNAEAHSTVSREQRAGLDALQLPNPCAPHGSVCAAIDDNADQADQLRIAGGVALGLGALLAGATIGYTFWVVAPTEPTTASLRWQLRPQLSPRHAGLAASFRF